MVNIADYSTGSRKGDGNATVEGGRADYFQGRRKWEEREFFEMKEKGTGLQRWEMFEWNEENGNVEHFSSIRGGGGRETTGNCFIQINKGRVQNYLTKIKKW